MLKIKRGFGCRRNKIGNKAQLEINFNVIFSIILIIAFIAVAIYVIVVFLGFKKCAETGLFKESLQNEIDRAYSSDMVSQPINLSLPGQIEKVCFIDLNAVKKGKDFDKYDSIKKFGLTNLNMFFYPLNNACEGQKAFQLEHLSMEKITQNNNPYCLDNKGKVNLKIEKGFYDALVRIS